MFYLEKVQFLQFKVDNTGNIWMLFLCFVKNV